MAHRLKVAPTPLRACWQMTAASRRAVLAIPMPVARAAFLRAVLADRGAATGAFRRVVALASAAHGPVVVGPLNASTFVACAPRARLVYVAVVAHRPAAAGAIAAVKVVSVDAGIAEPLAARRAPYALALANVAERPVAAGARIVVAAVSARSPATLRAPCNLPGRPAVVGQDPAAIADDASAQFALHAVVALLAQ